MPDAARYHYFFARAVLGIPESLGEFNARDLLHPGQALRRRARCTPTSWTAATEPVYGLQFYPQDVIRGGDRGGGGAVVARRRSPSPDARFAFVPTGRSRPSTTVTDELAAPRHRGAAAGPDPRLDRLPAAQRRRGLGPSADLPAGQRRAPADRHPGLRRAAAGPLGGRRRDHQGGPGHQLPRQPEVQGAQHPERRAARRRPRPPAAGAVRRPAGAPRRRPGRLPDRADHRGESSPRSWPSGWTGRWSGWSGTPRPTLRSYDEMAAGTAARRRWRFAPATARKAANLGFLAHRDVLGRVDDPGSPSAERGYDLVPRGSPCRSRRTADFVDAPAERRRPGR